MPGARKINRRPIGSHMARGSDGGFSCYASWGVLQSPLDLTLQKHETCQTGRCFLLLSFFNQLSSEILLQRSNPPDKATFFADKALDSDEIVCSAARII
ncbi:hypothetical protein ACFFP0_16320 [Rhizobium puerariae]|uniref:Uncharacterized protein n=1 Tax=Rhizobium puerariae TaxID=1585791 RepID=A0ABV6AM68_9HYPH